MSFALDVLNEIQKFWRGKYRENNRLINMVTNSHIWQALYASDNHTYISFHTFYICCELFGILFSSSHICCFVNYLNNPIVNSVALFMVMFFVCVPEPAFGCATNQMWNPSGKTMVSHIRNMEMTLANNRWTTDRKKHTQTHFYFIFLFYFSKLKYAQHHQCFE